MSLRDFLERFRPAGTPGASATGVPADHREERAVELRPALAPLADVQQEATEIRAAAEQEAKALRQNATQEAARMVDAAREHAPEVRRRAAEPLLREARQEAADALRAAGDRTISAMRERAVERMPHLVSHAVNDALRLTGWKRDEP